MNEWMNEWMNESFILFSTITIINEKQLYDKNEVNAQYHWNVTVGYATWVL